MFLCAELNAPKLKTKIVIHWLSDQIFHNIPYFSYIGPNGCSVPASVHNLKQDSYRVEYQTHDIGTYKVEVLHQGSMISSKPFLVEVCDPSRVKVIDVEDGIIGRDQTFKGNVNIQLR